MFSFVKSPNGVIKNWKDGFCLMRDVFFKVWPITLLLIGYYLISYPLGIYFQNVVSANNNGFVWSGFLIALFEVLIYVFLLGLLLNGVYQASLNKQDKFVDLLKTTVMRVIPFLMVYLLLLVIGFVGAGIIAGAFLVNYYVGIIITAPLFLAGVYLVPICFFVFPLVLIEKQGPWQAIKSSFALLWGNWWHIILSFVPVWVLAVPFVLFLAQFSSFNYIAWITNIIWGVIYCFSMLAFILVIFNDAKLRQKPIKIIKRK